MIKKQIKEMLYNTPQRDLLRHWKPDDERISRQTDTRTKIK